MFFSPSLGGFQKVRSPSVKSLLFLEALPLYFNSSRTRIQETSADVSRGSGWSWQGGRWAGLSHNQTVPDWGGGVKGGSPCGLQCPGILAKPFGLFKTPIPLSSAFWNPIAIPEEMESICFYPLNIPKVAFQRRLHHQNNSQALIASPSLQLTVLSLLCKQLPSSIHVWLTPGNSDSFSGL